MNNIPDTDQLLKTILQHVRRLVDEKADLQKKVARLSVDLEETRDRLKKNQSDVETRLKTVNFFMTRLNKALDNPQDEEQEAQLEKLLGDLQSNEVVQLMNQVNKDNRAAVKSYENLINKNQNIQNAKIMNQLQLNNKPNTSNKRNTNNKINNNSASKYDSNNKSKPNTNNKINNNTASKYGSNNILNTSSKYGSNFITNNKTNNNKTNKNLNADKNLNSILKSINDSIDNNKNGSNVNNKNNVLKKKANQKYATSIKNSDVIDYENKCRQKGKKPTGNSILASL